MNKKSLIVLTAVLANLFLVLASVSVSEYPAYLKVKKDTNFTTEMNISTKDKIYANEFDLYFNPEVLEAVSVDKGSFLSSDSINIYYTSSINNTLGVVSIAATRFGTTEGISGDGNLAKILFKAKQVGISNLELNMQIVDGDLQPVNDISISGSTITVITLIGDVNSDCKIDIFDLAAVGMAFGSDPIDVNLNKDADVYPNDWGDGIINIFDLATVGLNYGKKC